MSDEAVDFDVLADHVPLVYMTDFVSSMWLSCFADSMEHHTGFESASVSLGWAEHILFLFMPCHDPIPRRIATPSPTKGESE